MTPGAGFTMAVLGGATAAAGVALLVAGLLPAAPALGPALDRLYPASRQNVARSPIDRLRSRIQVPRADLAILGRSPDRYLLSITMSALLGLFVPPLLALVVAVVVGPITPLIPAGLGLAAAAGAAWLAHRDVTARAATARDEFTRGSCTYLDLAATQVRGGHGPMEALDRAASIGHGWVFDHLRGALLRAQLQLTPPWDELKRLSVELDVPELGDLADIMRTAATEGAQVYQTIRARADSLRDHIRTQQLELAEIRTNKLDIPAAALILVLLVLMGYPFMARLFTGQP